MATPAQQQAYDRYHNATNYGTTIVYDPQTLNDDFVQFVNNWTPKPVPPNPGLDDTTYAAYALLASTTFAPLYERDLPSHGPSFPLFQITGTVDSGAGTTNVDFAEIFGTDPTNAYDFTNGTIVLDSGPNMKVTFTDDGNYEKMVFTKMVSPLGVQCWNWQQIYVPKNRVLNNMYLCPIVFN